MIKIKINDKIVEFERVTEITNLLKCSSKYTLESQGCLYDGGDLYEWIFKREGALIHLVYNCRELNKHNDISDVNEAFALIKSEEWDGCCKRFNDSLTNMLFFCDFVVDSEYWNGSIKKFGFLIRNNIQFCEKVIASAKWNGSLRYFTESMLSNQDFCLEVLKSKKWNGDCSSFNSVLMMNVSFCISIVWSDKWNGDDKYIPDDMYSSYGFCYETIECPKMKKYMLKFDNKLLEHFGKLPRNQH